MWAVFSNNSNNFKKEKERKQNQDDKRTRKNKTNRLQVRSNKRAMRWKTAAIKRERMVEKRGVIYYITLMLKRIKIINISTRCLITPQHIQFIYTVHIPSSYSWFEHTRGGETLSEKFVQKNTSLVILFETLDASKATIINFYFLSVFSHFYFTLFYYSFRL